MNFLTLIQNFVSLTVLEDIGTAVSEVGTWIVQLFQSITALFWDASAATPTFTFLGWLTLVGFSIGMIFLIIRVIRNYIKVR